MRINEINLSERISKPVIVVDVQPEYANFSRDIRRICQEIVGFVSMQTGPILMLSLIHI